MSFLTVREKVAVATRLDLPAKMAITPLVPNDILAYADAIVETTLHKVMGGYSYHADGVGASTGQIFVFGSNLAGIHGAGAAYAALTEYGAIIGTGIGEVGRSYALPTKDERIETLPIDVIEGYVALFKQAAAANLTKRYFVTRVGCGLAGFTDAQIAPLFAGSPLNCEFPQSWAEYLEPEGRAKMLYKMFATKTERSMSTDWQEYAAEELMRLALTVESLKTQRDAVSVTTEN